MQTLEIREVVARWGVAVPPAEEFWRLADATALRQEASGGAYRANYERGPLLYALVQHYRPEVVLEVGTGRGYGTLCLARAMVEAGLSGRVYSVDRIGQEERLAWYLDRHDGAGPHSEQRCRAEVWAEVAEPAWLARIELLCGSVAARLGGWSGPRVELAFIDGDHSYAGVRHDFYSVLECCADRLGLLFDDYSGREEFGVARLVEAEVAPYLDCTVVDNDGSWSAGELPSLGHAMVWATGEGAPGWLRQAFPAARYCRQLRGYRRREQLKSLLQGWRRAWRP